MRVRYRFIEKWFVYERKGKWITWGTAYENCGNEFPEYSLLFRTSPDDDRRVRRHFDTRVREFAPSLEDAEVILGDYADRFRLRPEIHTIEGETHQEIRQQLWERIFDALEPEAAQPAIEPMPAWEERTAQPAYHVLSESGEAGEKEPS